MSVIPEFSCWMSDGEIRFGDGRSTVMNDALVKRYLAGAKMFFRARCTSDKLVNDCNYLVECWKEMESLIAKYNELKVGRRGKPGAFQEAFKDDLSKSFYKIWNMFEIKTNLGKRIEEYRSMTSFIVSPATMLSVCGLGVYLKDIGAGGDENNYTLCYTRPMIFGELFPSFQESNEFREWNKDALIKMDAILKAEPSLTLLDEIMKINLPIFDKFRQDRIDMNRFIEDIIAKKEEEKAKKKYGQFGRRPVVNDDSHLYTRTLDEHLNDLKTSERRSPGKRIIDEYVPKSPPPRPITTTNNKNGWQTVKKGRRP